MIASPDGRTARHPTVDDRAGPSASPVASSDGGGVRRRRLAAALRSPLPRRGVAAAVSLLGTRGRWRRPAERDGQDAPPRKGAAARQSRPQPPLGPQRDAAGRLEAVHGPGADPRVPRARRRARRRPYPELYVSRPDFHREMDWLDEHGYEAVTLEAVEDAWYRGGTLPEQTCRRSPSTTATGRSSPSPCRSCASTAGPACSTSRPKAPTSTPATSKR